MVRVSVRARVRASRLVTVGQCSSRSAALAKSKERTW